MTEVLTVAGIDPIDFHQTVALEQMPVLGTHRDGNALPDLIQTRFDIEAAVI